MNDILDDDLRNLLAPAGRTLPPSPASLQRARATLDRHIGPSRSRRTVLLAAAAGVAAIATGAHFALAGDDPSESPATGETPAKGLMTAGQALERLARAAEAHTPASWQGAAFWYTESLQYLGPQEPPVTRRVWNPHRGHGRLIDPGLKPATQRVEPKYYGVVGRQATPVLWDDLWSLPADPDKLKALLQAAVTEQLARKGINPQDDPDAALWSLAWAMLRESPAPPPLRATLYRVVGGLKGVELVGLVKDSRGRPGVAVNRTHKDVVEQVTLSQADGRILEEQSGNWVGTRVVEGPVDSVTAVPH